MPEPHLLEKSLRADLAPLTRRRFLRWGLGLSAAAVAGFALLRRSPRDATTLPSGFSTLTVQEYVLFGRLAQIMLPTSGTALPEPAQIPVAANADRLLAGLRPDIRQQLGLGLALFDNAAVLTGGHFGRFVDLPDAAATAYLDSWVNSKSVPQRAIAGAAMRLVKTAYWQDPRTWVAVGFAGPVSRRLGIAMQGNAPLPA